MTCTIASGSVAIQSKYIKMLEELKNIGYNVQLFRLNAATMGVPQHTQRLFFIASREDLNLPDLKLEFNEKPIPFNRIKCKNAKPNLPASKQILWENRQHGDRKMLFVLLAQKTTKTNSKILINIPEFIAK